MKKYHNILLTSVLLLSVSCNSMDWGGIIAASSPAVEKRFEQSMQWNDAKGYSTFKVDDDEYKLYVLTDVHLGNNETASLDKFVSDYCNDADAVPFVLCLGDLINNKDGFDNFIDHCTPIMQSDRDTMLFTVGNHDLYFGLWNTYRERFHCSSYYFEVEMPSGEKDLYISLDSGNGTLGTAQLKWLEGILQSKSDDYRKVIVLTHTHFFMADYSQGTTGNFTTEETYALSALFNAYGVDLVLTGHDHKREDVKFKGVRYIIVDALKDGYYATFNIGEDISFEVVPTKD